MGGHGDWCTLPASAQPARTAVVVWCVLAYDDDSCYFMVVARNRGESGWWDPVQLLSFIILISSASLRPARCAVVGEEVVSK